MKTNKKDIYIITITGVSGLVTDDEGIVEDKSVCDGVYDQGDSFADYIKGSLQPIITDGTMHFEMKYGELMTIVTYTATRELTDDEIEELREYTEGQLSDGVGEGFEQSPCTRDDKGNDIYLSPWYDGQELTITQNKIEWKSNTTQP